MNSFIIDYDSVRLILKEHDPLGIGQRARHSLTRRTYISTAPNHIWQIDGHDILKLFRFAIQGAIGL